MYVFAMKGPGKYRQPQMTPTGPPGEWADGEQIAGWYGEPPAFRFVCPAGCAPNAANQCRRIIGRAIQEAISLAENAADKLKARDAEALRLFRGFFGDPTRSVPWANNRPAADLVAHRFKAAADGFRTRVPHFRCSVAADPCGTAAAFVNPRAAPTAVIPLPRNTITLCPPFWSTPKASDRAAMVLHEMLHLLFWEFFNHQANLPLPGDPEERRRDNANCYHVFALRLRGHGVPQNWRNSCTDRPM
jgi:hypothetical protein